MGYGSYSSESRSVRAESLGYTDVSAPIEKLFTQSREEKIHPLMNPYGVFRESRDSAEHPNTVPIIIALDETGSMGNIPKMFLANGLPHIMDTIFQAGITDPQILFMGIGDHEFDQAPLQVGQFETSDQLLDQWLTSVWIEGKGGPNYGESYLLAWLFAAYHTEHDSFQKRNQKGFLFTIGDEETLREIPASKARNITGRDQYADLSADGLLKAAREKYHVFHLHINETHSGHDQNTKNTWKQRMKDDLILVDSYLNLPQIISDIIKKYSKVASIPESNVETHQSTGREFAEGIKSTEEFL